MNWETSSSIRWLAHALWRSPKLKGRKGHLAISLHRSWAGMGRGSDGLDLDV